MAAGWRWNRTRKNTERMSALIDKSPGAAIAEHSKTRPDTVLFEILNEPAPKFTYESWQEYWQAALALIRKSNPDRTVIIGLSPCLTCQRRSGLNRFATR